MTCSDFIRLNPTGWDTLWGGNAAPTLSFTYNNGYLPLEGFLVRVCLFIYVAGQPVRFDASNSIDPNGDRVDYYWNFGDGTTGEEIINSHIYNNAGTFTVNLTGTDNWGATNYLAQQIVVAAQTALAPAISPGTSQQFRNVNVTMFTVQPGPTIRYTVDGTDPTATSPIYTGQITIPFVRYTNVTVKARTFAAGVNPSAVISVVYQMIPAPCNVLAISSNCSLVCYNSIQTLKPGNHSDIGIP